MNAVFASRIFFGHFMYCSYPLRGVFIINMYFIALLLRLGVREPARLCR
jgi:hypothetical protein